MLIQVAPSESEQFTTTETAVGEQVQDGLVPRVLGRVEELVISSGSRKRRSRRSTGTGLMSVSGLWARYRCPRCRAHVNTTLRVPRRLL